MFAKLQIKGTLELITGLHIGGSDAFSAIGAVDSPVVKDAINNEPMIPGSSFKGKIRTLLAKMHSENPASLPYHNKDVDIIKNLFGASGDQNIESKLLFSDLFLINKEELYSKGAESITEVKFENTINRTNARAMPRQIERSIRGSKFAIDIIYEAYDENKIVEELQVLADGFKLLTYDYLGGSGSRGYGRVAFQDLKVKCVVGNIDEQTIDKCNCLFDDCYK